MELSNLSLKISYRDVKHSRLEFRGNKLLVILPFGIDPETFLIKHKDWINKKIKFIQDCIQISADKEIINRTENEFRRLIHSLAETSVKELSAHFNRIYFRKMETKWASCSSRNNLTFNKLMKYLPKHLIGYIISHEVAHIIEKRHSHRFWKLVSKKFPNRHELERELLSYWFLIQSKASHA